MIELRISDPFSPVSPYRSLKSPLSRLLNIMLRPIGPDIWVVDHDLYTLGIHFPGRMTIVRLSNQQLWLCSPVPISDALAASLADLGEVKAVVAPNRFHHVHLQGVQERYPEAKLYAAPGLEKKRKELIFEAVLDHVAPPTWAPDIQQRALLGAPAISEVLFFHPKSQSLITADFFMNVHQADGVLSRFIYWLEGCWKRPRIPRLFGLTTRDKTQMRTDLEVVSKWPVKRLIMAHGELVLDNAQELIWSELQRAFGVIKPAQLTAKSV